MTPIATSKAKRRGYEIRSIQKAAAVLSAFTQRTPELGVTEISQLVGLPRSVVQKIVITLKGRGFLRQSPGRRHYQVGPRLVEIVTGWLNANPLVREGAVIVRTLVQQTGMSGGLGVLDGNEVLYLVAMEAEDGVKATSRVGDRRPLHATATGKCLLAFLPEAERESLIERLPLTRYTDRTLVDVKVLRAELSTILAHGYALTRGERVFGLSGVSAPVWDHQDHVIAALSLAIPDLLCTEDALPRYIGFAVDSASRLSEQLGSAHGALRLPWPQAELEGGQHGRPDLA